MTQEEFEVLTRMDLEKLKFVLDSNWDVAIRGIWQPWQNGTNGVDGKDGTDGTDWKTVLNWIVDPTTQWVDGDFYINTNTWNIFWPKTAWVWGSWTPMVSSTSTKLLYDAIVAPTGWDYTKLSSAISAWKKTIFVRKWIYNETSTITLNTDWIIIIWESKKDTIIRFATWIDWIAQYANNCYVTNLTLDWETNNSSAVYIIWDGKTPGSQDLNIWVNNVIDNCILKWPNNTFCIYIAWPTYTVWSATLTGFENNWLHTWNIVRNCELHSSWDWDAFSFSLQKNWAFDNNVCYGWRIAFYMCRNSSCSYNKVVDSANQWIFFAWPSYDNVLNGNTIINATSSWIKLENQLEHTPLLAWQWIIWNTISNNTVTNSTVNGIEISGSSSNPIKNNSFIWNTVNWAWEHTVYLQYSENNIIKWNTLMRPKKDGWSSRWSWIYLVANVKNNVIEWNTITWSNYHTGISNREDNSCTGNIVKGNKITWTNTERTIWFQSNETQIEGNSIEWGNYAWIRILDASYCSISDNKLKNNTRDANNAYPEIWIQWSSDKNIVNNNVIISDWANKASNWINLDGSWVTNTTVTWNEYQWVLSSKILDTWSFTRIFDIWLVNQSQMKIPHSDGSGFSMFSYDNIGWWNSTEFMRNAYHNWTDYKRFKAWDPVWDFLIDEQGKFEYWTAPWQAWNDITNWQQVFGISLDWDLLLKHTTTPSNPWSGYVKIYFKSDGKLYKKDSAWVETEIGGWGGWLSWGSSINWSSGTGLSMYMNDSYWWSWMWQEIRFWNIQTNSLIAMRLHLWTSAIWHTGLSVYMPNASTSTRWISIDASSTGTWTGIIFLWAWWTWFKWIAFNWVPVESTQLIWMFTIKWSAWSSGWDSSWLYVQFVNRHNSTTSVRAWIRIGVVNDAVNWRWYWVLVDIWNNAALWTSDVDCFKITNVSWSNTWWWVWFRIGNLSTAVSNISTQFLNFSHIVTWTLSDRVLAMSSVTVNRESTRTTWTTTDNYDTFHFKQTARQNWAWWTFVNTGSILKLENESIQTAGTLTDTNVPLSLINTTSIANGWHIRFNAYTPWNEATVPNNTMWWTGTNLKIKDNAWVVKTATLT